MVNCGKKIKCGRATGNKLVFYFGLISKIELAGVKNTCISELCVTENVIFNPFQSNTLPKVTAHKGHGSKVIGQKIVHIPCSRSILLYGTSKKA